MNPFATVAPPAEVITRRVNGEMLPAFRTAVSMLIMAGLEWASNDVLAEFAAAESAVDVANGEVAVYGGYDTNHVRRWNVAFAAFNTALDAPITVPLADGTTETTTIKAVVMRLYAPYQG